MLVIYFNIPLVVLCTYMYVNCRCIFHLMINVCFQVFTSVFALNGHIRVHGGRLVTQSYKKETSNLYSDQT